MQKFIEALQENGYKPNRHGDAYDNGLNRVFFTDSTIFFAEFNNAKAQLIVNEARISTNMSVERAMKIIKALEV